MLSIRNGPGSTNPSFRRPISTGATSSGGDKDFDSRNGVIRIGQMESSTTDSDWTNSKKSVGKIEIAKDVLVESPV